MKKALLIISAAILLSSCATQSHLQKEDQNKHKPVNYWF